MSARTPKGRPYPWLELGDTDMGRKAYDAGFDAGLIAPQPDLREKITTAIVETLQNRVDGAGSDLEEVGDEVGDETWLYVRGNVDVSHLVSEVLHAIGRGER